MAKVKWSPQAIQDLDEICAYIHRSSEQYALIVADKVTEVVDSLPEWPYLGAVVPEYKRENIRERQVYDYRIIYHLKEGEIEVITILHGARRLPRTPPI